MLKKGSFEDFLQKWYSQDLFTSLRNHPHFQSILTKRKKQEPAHLAHFLEHYSLAKKNAPEIAPSTIFIHGKEDLKYAHLYRTISHIENIFTIENAGHAVHLENPKACAKIILGAVNEHY